MRVTDEDVKRIVFEAKQAVSVGTARQRGGHKGRVRRIVEEIVERERKPLLDIVVKEFGVLTEEVDGGSPEDGIGPGGSGGNGMKYIATLQTDLTLDEETLRFLEVRIREAVAKRYQRFVEKEMSDLLHGTGTNEPKGLLDAS